MRLRYRLMIAAAVATAMGAGLLAVAAWQISDRARPLAETQLARWFGAPVRVAGARTNLFNRFSLRHVHIGPPAAPWLDVERVDLEYAPLRILRAGGDVRRGLRRIVLVKPKLSSWALGWFAAPRSSYTAIRSAPASARGVSPAGGGQAWESAGAGVEATIVVRGGTVDMPADRIVAGLGAWALTSINGTVVLSRGGAEADLSGRPSGFPARSFRVRAQSRPPALALRVEVEGLGVDRLNPSLSGSGLLISSGAADVTVSLAGQTRGGFEGYLHTSTISATADLNQTALVWPEPVGALQVLGARLEASRHGARLVSSTALWRGSTWTVTGSVEGGRQNSGWWVRPDTATVRAIARQVGFAGLQADELEVSGHWGQGVLRGLGARIRMADGYARLDREGDAWRLFARNFDLGRFRPSGTPIWPEGRLTGDMTLGPARSSGSVRLDGPRPFIGQMAGSKGRARIAGRSSAPDGWRGTASLRLTRDRVEVVSLSARRPLRGGTMELTSWGRVGLPGAGPTQSNWVAVNWKVALPGLKRQVTGRLSLSREGRFDGGVSAEAVPLGVFRSPPSGPGVQEPPPLEGAIDVEARLGGWLASPRVDVSVLGRGLKYDGWGAERARFAGRWADGKLVIDRLEAVGGGRLWATGEIGPSAGGEPRTLRVEGGAAGFEPRPGRPLSVEKFSFSGCLRGGREWELKGGTLTAQGLGISGLSWARSEANLEAGPGGWRADAIRLGDEVTGWIARRAGTWSGRLAWQTIRLPRWLAMTGAPSVDIEGRSHGEVALSPTGSGGITGHGPGLAAAGEASRVRMWAVLEDGRVAGAPCRASVRALMKGGFLTIQEASLWVGSGRLELSGNLNVDRWEAQPLAVTIRGVDAGLLARLAGQSPSGWLSEVTGPVTGRISVNGPVATSDKPFELAAPRLTRGAGALGETSIQGTWSSAAGRSRLRITSARARYESGEIRLREGTEIEETGPATCAYRVLPELRNVAVGPVVVFGGFSASGTVTLDGQPRGQGRLETGELWLNQMGLDQAVMEYRHAGGRVTLGSGDRDAVAGEVDVTRWPAIAIRQLVVQAGRRGTMTANGRIEGGWPVDLLVVARGLDAGAIASLLDLRPSVSGRVDFEGRFAGTPPHPRATLSLTLEQGQVEHQAVDALSVLAQFHDGDVYLKQFRAVRKGTFLLSAAGHIPLDPDHAQDLSVTIADGNLSLLAGLWPEMIARADGRLEGRVRLAGSRRQPRLDGWVRVREGSLRMTDIFPKVTDLTLDLALRDETITVSTASARVGGGRMSVDGEVALRTLARPEFDLRFQTDPDGVNVSLRGLAIPSSSVLDKVLPDVPSRGRLRGRVQARGVPERYTLAGEAEISEARFTYPPRRAAEGAGYSLINAAVWDLALKAGSNTRYENEKVQAQIQGEIRIRGRAQDGNLTVDGWAETDKGEAVVENAIFTVNAGRLEFRDSHPYVSGRGYIKITRPDPDSPPPDVARGESRREVPDVILMEVDRARVEDAKPRFSSQNYPSRTTSAQAMQYALGLDPTVPTDIPRAVLRWFDSAVTTPLIQKTLLKRTPLGKVVDTVRVQAAPVQKVARPDEGTVGGGAPRQMIQDARLSVGKQFGTQWYVSYGVRVDPLLEDKLSLRHDMELSYRLEESLFLKGIYSDSGGELGDKRGEKQIRIEKRYRF